MAIPTRAALGRRALAPLAGGFAALLLIAGALLWLVLETRDNAAEVAAGRAAREALVRVMDLVQDAETAQRGYLLTGERPYLEPHGRAADELPAAMQRLAALMEAVPEARAGRERLAGLVADKFAELRETLDLAARGEREAALAVVRSDRGKAAMDEARGVAASLFAAVDARLDASGAALAALGRALLAATAVGLLVILALAAASVRNVVRHTRDIERARAAVEAANAGLEERVRERTAELAAANGELAAANDEVQRFAYIVSHDLRAPLVNVMGFTSELEVALAAVRPAVEAARERDPGLVPAEALAAVREDVPEAIGFIRSSTERMDRLISAILRLSREGRRQLTPEMVRMDELFAGLAATVQHQLAAAGAELKVEAPLPNLVSDRLALEQVFGNLLDNAAKYLDRSRPGVIAVRGRAEGSRAVYEVEDNGRGIDPRDHERIFELFRRSGAQDRPGEGIGLAHVRALVRRLGGGITCASEPGRGSVFRVNLPRTAAALREGGAAT